MNFPWRPLGRVVLGIGVVVTALTVLLVNPSCQAINSEVAGAQPSRLEADVRSLCGTRKPRTVAEPEGLAEAERIVRAAWEKMGLQVRTQEFAVEGRTYRNYSVVLGPERAERIVVGAHYDVFDRLPGADDNASGVAGILELTRLLLDKKPTLNHAIELVAWTNEEPPYFATENMGSFAHAAALKREGVAVRLAISVEMIGYFSETVGSQKYPSLLMRLLYPSRGNFLAIVGSASPASWWLVRRAKAVAARWSSIPLRSINAPAFIPGVDYSDHRSFWEHGFPALMVTDTSFYRNARYHTESDLPETLDYDRMAKSVNALFAMATEL